MAMPRPVPPRPAATCDDSILLDVRPVLGVARGGCVIACGVMVCGFFGVAGVTQKALAGQCRVPWPLDAGMPLGGLVPGLQHYGIAARSIGALSLDMIRASLMRGLPVIGGHAVAAAMTVGHAVVIAGILPVCGRPPTLVVCDPNFAFPILVPAATMIGSARSGVLIDGVRR